MLLQIFRIISYAISILRIRPSQMGLELWLHIQTFEGKVENHSHSLAPCMNLVEYHICGKIKKKIFWTSVNL